MISDDPLAGIRLYYKRYKAVLDATLKYETLRKAGGWDAPFIATTMDIVKIVVSRSMWYSHYKLFDKLSRYPQMIEWLDETEDAPTNIELWGFDCDVYHWAHFEAFLKRDGEPLESSDDESDGEKAQTQKKKPHKKANTKDKGKAKAKAKAASPSEEESEPELKSAQKSHKKGKAKAKAASSSGEESKTVQKAHKKGVASGSRGR